MNFRLVAVLFRRLVWTFTLCCGMAWLSANAEGFATQYGSRLWQMEDGLPHTIVQAITQTREGYLWVGTREGLARFDGVSFTPVEFTGESAHPSITSLCEGRDGSLWIGTEKTGVFCLHDGKLSHFRMTDGSGDDRGTTVREDRDGNLWIGTSHGLARLKNGKIQFIKELTANVWSLCMDPAGDIWVAEIGIKRLSGETVNNYAPRDVVIKSVRAAYCDQDGTLWFGQADGLIQVKDGRAVQYKKENGPSSMVSAILKDRAGNVWVGTYGGLSRFVDGKFTSESDNSMSAQRVFSIFEDREGNIWIGSEGGLVRLTTQYFTAYSKANGLTHDRTISVLEGRDKSMWIGTWGGGLNHLKNGVITAYTKTNGLASDFIYGLHESRDGSLWIGLDYTLGLDRLKDGQFTHFGTEEGLTGAPVAVIHEDQQGVLWVGTRGGLYRWMEGKFIRLDGLPHREINILCDSAQGGLLIGTGGGLVRRNTDGQIVPVVAKGDAFKDSVFSLYEDAEMTLWIGTKGNGLKRFKNGKLDSYNTKEGLDSDIIYAILEDGRSNLWLSSGKGISRVSKDEFEKVAAGKLASLTPLRYGKTDGIINSSQFSDAIQPAAWKCTDGRLWFRTTQGVVVVDPETIAVNQVPPPVLIEKIIADKKEVALGREKSAGRSADLTTSSATRFTISPGRGDLEICYAALSFRDPQKNRFKYKLEGWDLDWIDADARRIAYYNNIPPGNYRFHVLAANNDGVWNNTGASIGLYLEPHFWQTWWFLGLCGFTAVGAVAGVARYVTRQKMRRQLERLEQQHALERERSRIARDIHDDLGASVTHITLLSELSEHENQQEVLANTRKIGAACREIAQSLDEIVWAVNPAHDTLEGLVEYLSQSADEFLERSDIRVRLTATRKIPPCMIATEVRHQLFLSYREALNNVVKHAGATEIHIDLSVTHSQFQITISDNGHGFAMNSRPNAGDGLGNMSHRLDAIGGQLEVSSQPGKGSQVKMTIELSIPQMSG